MSYYEVIFLGLVCLVTPWLARMASYEITRKPFDLVGVAGTFFLLASAFGLGVNMVEALRGIGTSFETVSFIIGWVALAAGALWAAVEIARGPMHILTRGKA